MRLRDLTLLGVVLLVAAAAGFVFSSQESHAEELSPDATPAAETPVPEESHPAVAAEPVAAEGDVQRRGNGGAVAAEASVRRTVDTSGWTKGIVRGDIQLAVSVLDRLTTITVSVEEARPAITETGFRHPYRALVSVERGRGTPTFEVTDIPFSEYPYIVSVFAPGLNGSRRTVSIDATSPLVDDVVLAITPGAPFTVLVRDQDAVPYSGVDVQMAPVGEPKGRPGMRGTSDNFGSVVFENVLAGDYEVCATQNGQLLGERQTIAVQPGNRVLGVKVQGQGHALTIARGVPLQLQVSDPAGYGVADVKVTATASDRLKLTELVETTNFGGRATFAHLTPGVWHIAVTKDKFQRSDLQVTIKAGQQPELREVRIRQLRY